MARRTIASLISVSALARLQNVHIDTARNRLVELNRKHGGRVIIWIGTRMYTTLSLIRQADERWLEEHEVTESKIEELQKSIATLDEENLRLRARIRKLEDMANHSAHTEPNRAKPSTKQLPK